MGLGQRIRQLRQARGLTQDQLAGTEVTKSFISLLERDKTSPSIETLTGIARRLGTSMDALLGSQGNLAEHVATGLLELSAQALRRRNAVQARDLLDAAKVLVRVFHQDEAARELSLQQAQLAVEEREFDRAVKLATEAKTRADEARDLWRAGRALIVLGTTALRQRRIPDAISHLSDSLDVLRQARASRDPARVEALLHLGSALVYSGDYEKAIKRYEEAAQSQVAQREPVLRGRAMWGLGAAYRRRGELTSATQALEVARDVLEKVEELPDLVRVLHNLGQVAMEEGKPRDALRHLHHALRVADRLPMPVIRASTRTEIARVHVTLGNLDDAAAFATQALEGATYAGDPVEAAEAQVVLARVAFARGKTAEGTRLMKTAADTFTAHGMPNRIADLARDAGMALLERS